MCFLNFKLNDNVSYKHGSTIQYHDTVTADVICKVMHASSMGWKYFYVGVYVFLDIFHTHVSYLCILPVHPQTWGFISSIVREGCQFGILAGECSQQINGNPPSILQVFVGLVFLTSKPCQHWCLRPTKCFVAAVACGTLWGQQPSSNSKNLVRILRIFWLSFLESWHTLPLNVFWGFLSPRIGRGCPFSCFWVRRGRTHSSQFSLQKSFDPAGKQDQFYHVLPLMYF